jgi:hypothetical protein
MRSGLLISNFLNFPTFSENPFRYNVRVVPDSATLVQGFHRGVTFQAPKSKFQEERRVASSLIGAWILELGAFSQGLRI